VSGGAKCNRIGRVGRLIEISETITVVLWRTAIVLDLPGLSNIGFHRTWVKHLKCVDTVCMPVQSRWERDLPLCSHRAHTGPSGDDPKAPATSGQSYPPMQLG
jgi:hypothetical protein